MTEPLDRRQFIQRTMVGAVAVGLGRTVGPLGPGQAVLAAEAPTPTAAPATAPTPPPYTGPNVILVRYGGGVRRLETIDAEHTYSPFMCHELRKRATLFTDMELAELAETTNGQEQKVETSHGQGTLHIITGKYKSFINRTRNVIGEEFEPTVPTLFEYLRKAYDIPIHQTLIVNNEDRKQEEFFTSSNHHMFGVDYRCDVLSLYRFKTYLLRRQIDSGQFRDEELKKKQQELAKLEKIDYRRQDSGEQGPQLQAFWEQWRQYYGETGLVNPRGDRVLTELTVQAIRQLRPKLIMVNYTDPDYVHWGNINHYTRGIAIIDQGIERLVKAVEADEAYRDNTVFVIVPDCGRDNNRMMDVPCQHHFGGKWARQIFAMMFGTGVARGRVVDRRVEQIQVAATIGQIMGFKTEFAEGDLLQEALT